MNRLHVNILVSMLFLSAAYSFVQVKLNLKQEVVSGVSDIAWAIAFALLVAVWANKEPKQKIFKAPFEFGAFLYFAWPVVLPYYLFKTRGIEGLIVFIGFAGLYLAPFLSGLVVYAYFS